MIDKTDEKQGMRRVTHSEPERVQVRRQRAQTVGLRGREGTAALLSISRRLFPVTGMKEA